MSNGIVRVVLGETFTTQRELEARISATLQSVPRDEPFEQPFLAAVINGYHVEVVEAGQTCTGLFEFLTWDGIQERQLPVRYPSLLRGWFDPFGGWCDVTAYPWKRRSPRQDAKAALRDIVSQEIQPQPPTEAACQFPGCRVRDHLEYHHDSPTFDEMAMHAMLRMDESEIATRFGYQKFDRENPYRQLSDCIPRTHPAVQYLREAHRTNRWFWLCRAHHAQVNRKFAFTPDGNVVFTEHRR